MLDKKEVLSRQHFNKNDELAQVKEMISNIPVSSAKKYKHTQKLYTNTFE